MLLKASASALKISIATKNKGELKDWVPEAFDQIWIALQLLFGGIVVSVSDVQHKEYNTSHHVF
jgi:hypothetical protein